MKNERPDKDYELFYMELPQADYLNDIEIQDEYDNSDENQGLSEDQVLKIAKDSLEGAAQQYQAQHSDDQNLLSDNQE